MIRFDSHSLALKGYKRIAPENISGKGVTGAFEKVVTYKQPNSDKLITEKSQIIDFSDRGYFEGTSTERPPKGLQVGFKPAILNEYHTIDAMTY